MDTWVKGIGQHRGKPRIFLDGVQAVRAGFSPGDAYEVEIDGQRVILKKNDDGSRVVSGRERRGRVMPVIDINSRELLQMFEGMEAIRVVVSKSAVYLLPLASEQKRVQRLGRLRATLKAALPLKTGSISHGGGVLTHAIHQGLSDAGFGSELLLANDIREDLLVQAIEHNDCWNDRTMALAVPMQELVQDDWLMSKLPKLDILEAGIPCESSSKAGRARNKNTVMESHEKVGHLVASALAIIHKTQPAICIIENVTDYAHTASAYILRSTFRDMGYDVHEAVVNGADFGCLEGRVRWSMVAVTRGLEFDFNDLAPKETARVIVDSILDKSIQSDDPRWRTFQYLKDKRERDEEKGSGFKNQYITNESEKVPTLRKGYHKAGSPDPRLLHPTNPELSRLLTAEEHARVKGVPEGLIEGLSETNAHQLLGQGIVYEPFRALGERIGECLTRFATRESMLNTIAAVVGHDPVEFAKNTGQIAVMHSDDAEITDAMAKSFHDGHVQAAYDPQSNTMVFLFDRIPAGREAAVLLHEVVHHRGRPALPDGRFENLVEQLKGWAQRAEGTIERTVHDAAAARVATAGVAGPLADEELFAYAVEEAVARGVTPSAAAVEGSAQAWLHAVEQSLLHVLDKLLGNDQVALDAQDLVDLAYGLAQIEQLAQGTSIDQTPWSPPHPQQDMAPAEFDAISNDQFSGQELN